MGSLVKSCQLSMQTGLDAANLSGSQAEVQRRLLLMWTGLVEFVGYLGCRVD